MLVKSRRQIIQLNYILNGLYSKVKKINQITNVKQLCENKIYEYHQKDHFTTRLHHMYIYIYKSDQS